MKVGFIGLGTMGASMAANLQKAGYKLVVHDMQRQNAEPPPAGRRASGPTRPRPWPRPARSSSLSLPGPPEVEAVALGEDGLIDGMQEGLGLLRSLDQLADAGAQDRADLRREGPAHARCARQRRARRRQVRQARDLGRRRQGRVRQVQGACSTPSAIRRATSARSARARSPSSCTTAPAMPSRRRSPRCSRMGVKGGVEPLALWEAVRRAPSAAAAPSTG